MKCLKHGNLKVLVERYFGRLKGEIYAAGEYKTTHAHDTPYECVQSTHGDRSLQLMLITSKGIYDTSSEAHITIPPIPCKRKG